MAGAPHQSHPAHDASDGAQRLGVSSHGLGFEGGAGFITLQGNRGDDSVFLIPNVDLQCSD